MSPLFYGWLKFSNRFFPRKDLATAIKRAAIEQVSYGPLALTYFFFGMSVLELKPLYVCVNEVKEKFWVAYVSGLVYWPVAQTVNFYCISDKNRIVFVSMISFIWTTYLSHIKAQAQRNVLTDKGKNLKKQA